MGNPTEKMHLLEEILSVLKYDTLLYFPASVHAILAASVASDPFPKSSKDAEPEKLLCDKVFKSIITSLNDPDVAILPQNSHIPRGKVPLPRRDAQLVAISLGRIPLKDQQKIISRFIREFESAVIKIKDTDRLRNLIYTDKRYASFLAKTITLCSHIIDMVCIGKSLSDLFSDCVNGLYYDIDYFTKPIGMDDDFSDICKDQFYVGLWRESFKSDLPPMNNNHVFHDPLSSRDIVSYTSILDICLGLGFESARTDKCYLLFSAWNAGTKAIPYAPKEWFNTLATTGWSKNGHGKQLRAIRESICNIYETLETGEYTPDSLLSSLLKRKRMTSLDSNKRDSGVALLKSSVQTSVEILNAITAESHDSLQFSSGDSVVIEATLNFISFLAAMFTKHETDYLSLMVKYHKRKRKTSSFSGESIGEEDAGSDECSNDSDDDGFHDFDEDEEDDDATMEGLRKLEDICSSLGASPLHPDWLDSTCHLRSNITVIECIQLAESMLSSLTSFGTMIFEKFDAQLKDALFAHKTDCITDEKNCNSAIEIVRSIRFSDKTSQTESSNMWKKELASAFHLDESFVDAICNDFPCRNAKFAKETFALHASSRIRGGLYELFSNGDEWLPSQAGYRTAEEWELLFSDSFVGACADLHLSTPQKSKFADLLQTRRLLQSTLSAIVTVNALLRFGISGNMGPTQLSSIFASEHSGSKVGNSNIISPHHTSDIRHYVNEKSLSLEEKKQTVNSINSAICFLARIQAHGYHDRLRRSARAALCHLVSQDTDVLNLETPYVLHTSICAMRRLLQVDGNSVHLFDKIVEPFRFHEETDNDFHQVLLLTLGYRVPIRICSVADSCADAWTLLRSNDLNVKYWDGALTEDIKFFCDVLLGDSRIVSCTRLNLLKALRGALSAEDISSISNGLTDNILNQLTARGDVALTLLVQNDICNDADDGIAFETSKALCAIMMLLSRPLKDLIQTPKLDFFRSTLSCLRQNMKLWIGHSSLQHVLCLATYLAIRLGIVKEICDELISLTREKSDLKYLDSVEIFCRFINSEYFFVLFLFF